MTPKRLAEQFAARCTRYILAELADRCDIWLSNDAQVAICAAIADEYQATFAPARSALAIYREAFRRGLRPDPD